MPDDCERFCKRGNSLNVLEPRQVDSLRNDFPDSANRVVEFVDVDEFVKSVSVVIAARQIHRRNAKFRRDKRNVGERADSGRETLAGNVRIEVGIVAVVINGVIFAFAVNLDKEFQGVRFFRQKPLRMKFSFQSNQSAESSSVPTSLRNTLSFLKSGLQACRYFLIVLVLVA